MSKLTSKFVKGYFDRSISFNQKLFKKDFNFIIKNKTSINQRSYDFEKQNIKSYLKETNNINYLIVEGIFAREFSITLENNNFYFLELKINKKDCMRRAVLRDLKERGKVKKQAENDFLISWDIYYDKFKNTSIKNKANKFIISKMTNIDKILNKIFN